MYFSDDGQQFMFLVCEFVLSLPLVLLLCNPCNIWLLLYWFRFSLFLMQSLHIFAPCELWREMMVSLQLMMIVSVIGLLCVMCRVPSCNAVSGGAAGEAPHAAQRRGGRREMTSCLMHFFVCMNKRYLNDGDEQPEEAG
jgi:hypothetical protein